MVLNSGEEGSSWERWGRDRELSRGLERALIELGKGFEEELVELGKGFEFGWGGELLGALGKGSGVEPRPREGLARVREGF